MKLVIFSDVHGNKEVLERIISFNPDAEYFISLGDSELNMDYLLDLDIVAIKGNYPRDAGFTYEHTMDVFGKKLLFTHGHKEKVHKGINKLLKKAFQNDIDIALYGHTHIPRVDKANNLLIINPGSVHRPRAELEPSYLILNIEKDGKIEYIFKEAQTNLTMDIK